MGTFIKEDVVHQKIKTTIKRSKELEIVQLNFRHSGGFRRDSNLKTKTYT